MHFLVWKDEGGMLGRVLELRGNGAGEDVAEVVASLVQYVESELSASVVTQEGYDSLVADVAERGTEPDTTRDWREYRALEFRLGAVGKEIAVKTAPAAVDKYTLDVSYIVDECSA